MANEINKAPFKVIATKSSRIKDLPIANGQLIFIQDLSRIALDFGGKRTFYNQITELDKDSERTSMTDPVYGYYFVIDTAILWLYKDGWIQVSGTPGEVMYIGTELPELGQANKLYVNKQIKNISVWDEESHSYIVVADCTDEISDTEIEDLFKAE